MILRILAALLALCAGGLQLFAAGTITVKPGSEGAVIKTTRKYTATLSGVSGGVN
ncbi:MAG: hypothetical protein SGI92_00230 [Bryobacteraceae bacterium]|nr:hypothetical protein [Bryobacteraceae bacterium]